MSQEKPSALVRAYVEKIGPTASQVASTWGDKWVAGTKRFGKQLLLIGSLAFVMAWPVPDDGWKAIIATMGVATIAVGWWHWRNADGINRLGMESEARDSHEAE